MRWIFVLILFLAAGTTAAAEPQPPFFTPDACPAGTVLPEGVAAECGTVTVLEDRADPDGPRIRLRVVTLWRTDRELRPDPVLYINGGPGLWTGLDAEGLANWARAVKEQGWLGDRRLVLFDQRGVGASQILPSSCGRLDQFLMLEILDHTSRSDERWRASFREKAETCWSRFRQAGHDPGRITTLDIAADVADLRRAFGYGAWNLWGISFGSRVALTVMRDHPQGVRTAILEGVWPPEANFYDYARNTGEAFGYCAAWPVPRSPAADAAPVTSAIPTLLISGAFDPRTPPSWAEAISKRLPKSYSYVFAGYGHGVLDHGQPCAQEIAGRFLDAPSQRPDHDCFANLVPMIFAPPPR